MENTVASVVASKEIGLEVNTEKTKYIQVENWAPLGYYAESNGNCLGKNIPLLAA